MTEQHVVDFGSGASSPPPPPLKEIYWPMREKRQFNYFIDGSREINFPKGQHAKLGLLDGCTNNTNSKNLLDINFVSLINCYGYVSNLQ